MKKAISIIISCIILVSSVSVSVIATSNNDYNFWDNNQPLPQGSSFLDQYCYYSYPENPSFDIYFQTDRNDIYLFYYNNQMCFVSPNSGNFILYEFRCDHNEHNPYYSANSTNGLTQYNDIYYCGISFGSNTYRNFYAPVYDTLYDGLNDFENYVNNGYQPPNPSPSPQNLNYSLPAGNVAYIEFSVDFDSFNLQTTMPTSSTVIGSDPWPQSNQYYGFASSIPSGSFTPPSSRITWSRNGRTSIAGITKNAIFDYGPHHPSSGNYLVVYNPAYYGGTDNGPYEFMNNGSITISASNVISITVLQLDSQLTFGQNGVLDVDTTLTGEEYNGEFDEETGDIIWENGSVPVEGGGNLPVSSESQFNSFLSNLIQKIINIFAPAQEAIQTLSSAISGFASYLYALYVWLPAPVLSLLTSAITLAIVIGVIKVFL